MHEDIDWDDPWQVAEFWFFGRVMPALLYGGIFFMVFVEMRSNGWLPWRPRRAEQPEALPEPSAPIAPPVRRVRDTSGMTSLRKVDPEFSQALLEDFAYRLYATIHRARHELRAMRALEPYMLDAIRRELMVELTPGLRVEAVVVGALDSKLIERDDRGYSTIDLTYTSNLIYAGGVPGATERTQYVRERWRLRRKATVRTKPPAYLERLGCPNCGAPFLAADHRRCAHCQQVVGDGRFAWQVVAREVLEQAPLPPSLTNEVAERGTHDETVFHPDHERLFSELCRDDPSLDETNLLARLQRIYVELNAAWNANDLSKFRAWATGPMCDYLQYWLDAYGRQQLKNTLTRARITRITRVKVVRDRHFDAITFRLWATGLDVTSHTIVDRVVCGSPTRPREYSEYWTFVRGSGAHGTPRVDMHCPSCGAPLIVGESGCCEYCGTHVTHGEFDWILSKIEQDEVYGK